MARLSVTKDAFQAHAQHHLPVHHFFSASLRLFTAEAMPAAYVFRVVTGDSDRPVPSAADLARAMRSGSLSYILLPSHLSLPLHCSIALSLSLLLSCSLALLLSCSLVLSLFLSLPTSLTHSPSLSLLPSSLPLSLSPPPLPHPSLPSPPFPHLSLSSSSAT